MITLFVVMTLFGGVFLILAFILSEIVEFFEGAIEALFDGLNIDIDIGGEGLGYFMNLRSWLAFITFFGAAGLIGNGYFKFGPGGSVIFAIFCGLLSAFLVGLIVTKLTKHEVTGQLRDEDFINQVGTITSSIVDNSAGQITVVVAGQTQRMTAYSVDGNTINYGLPAKIQKRVGHVVYVLKV